MRPCGFDPRSGYHSHLTFTQMIDLRSDTVTKPTSDMLEYMFRAAVGDDVFQEDPSVNELQRYAADLFGVERALFCPSGTMTNQIAIKAQTQPGDEVICDEGSHVYYYEGGGIGFNAGASTRTLKGERGIFTAEQLKEVLRPSNVHYPKTSLVVIENTCNRGGGKVFDLSEIERVRKVCNENGLRLHLDGARLFNALIAEGRSPKDFGRTFDSISICLSKGLGAPMGSLLLGDHTLIDKALRIRKVLGGGMRQAGYMAAAGLYALQHHVERLSQDHALAKQIGEHLSSLDYVKQVLPVETNIVVFELAGSVSTGHFLKHLETHGIRAFEVGSQRVRFVTHLDIPTGAFATIGNCLSCYSSS